MPSPFHGRQAPDRRGGGGGVERLAAAHDLITFIQLDLDGAADLEGADGGPHAALTVQDPILDALLRGGFEQFPEIARAQVRHERQAGAGHVLVDQEAAHGGREEAEGVELSEAVVGFEGDEAKDGHGQAARAAGVAGTGALQLGMEEGGDVGARLGHDEMVDVEEFTDAGERGVAVVIVGLAP